MYETAMGNNTVEHGNKKIYEGIFMQKSKNQC